MDIDSKENILKTVINRYAEMENTDVLLINGALEGPPTAIQPIVERRKRKNLLLILVTPGGDPDFAYRLARYFQGNYEKFTLFVSGYCKSAGTLIALGANELIFSDFGELGPLDVQMSKDDDLIRRQSGLTVMSSLNALHEKAFLAFEKFLLETIDRGSGAITLKTAADISTKVTTGLFAPLYEQIDPLHIGEAARAISIATHYGVRLIQNTNNMNSQALEKLISNYPSHGFVIDKMEAQKLFHQVRPPNHIEEEIVKGLGNLAILPRRHQGYNLYIDFLSEEYEIEEQQLEGENNDTVRNSEGIVTSEHFTDARENFEHKTNKSRQRIRSSD